MLHIKPKKYVKRVLLSLLIFILSFSVVSMLVTVIVFHTAFPRADSMSELSMSYSDIDRSDYPYERVSFLSGENELSGYIFSCREPEALVVIAAGFRESGSAHLPEMMTFADSGFSVFCYDATGVGESEGSGTVGLSQPALDLRAALNHIASDAELSSLPVLLYGFSAGGYAAAVCADSPGVKAAVILSGFESPTILMRETARSYVGVLADIEYPFLMLENSLIFGADADKSASSCINSSDVPTAVYESAYDDVIPFPARLSGRLDESDPMLKLTVCEDPALGGHSAYRLSEEAVSARDSGSSDIIAANELDPDFTSSVLEFYRSALKC